MNLRLSPDVVRLRISLDEAKALENQGALSQRIPFANGDMMLDVKLNVDQRIPVVFRFERERALATIREQDLFVLLEDRPGRGSCIRSSLETPTRESLEFVFEIDLFSRKSGKAGTE